jgi:hypothetical protein
MLRGRRERIAAALWIALAIVIGNGIYDVLITRGIKEYLFRRALAESGVAPPVPLGALMSVTARDAAFVGLTWAGAILLVGFITIRLLRPSR